MQLWEQKKETAVEKAVHIDFTLESDAEDEISKNVQTALTPKKVTVIETFDGGFEVSDAVNTASDVIKLGTSATAMRKFANDGWFEFVLPVDTRTRLDFVKPGVTRVQMKTRMM